jgi:hypothetical protein
MVKKGIKLNAHLKGKGKWASIVPNGPWLGLKKINPIPFWD